MARGGSVARVARGTFYGAPHCLNEAIWRFRPLQGDGNSLGLVANFRTAKLACFG